MKALVIDNGSKSARLFGDLSRAAGWQCAVLPVSNLDPALALRDADAVILSGTKVPVFAPGYADEIRLIRTARVPVLGICGGMQLIGLAFGVMVRQGTPAIGRTQVRLQGGVELFHGLPAEIALFQRHIYQLPAVPAGFALLASSADCEVEGIGHTGRAIFGMQAHLEFRAEGRYILRRFLRLAELRMAARPRETA
jgi:GMP synthase-like glutamine amidotransferase